MLKRTSDDTSSEAKRVQRVDPPSLHVSRPKYWVPHPFVTAYEISLDKAQQSYESLGHRYCKFWVPYRSLVYVLNQAVQASKADHADLLYRCRLALRCQQVLATPLPPWLRNDTREMFEKFSLQLPAFLQSLCSDQTTLHKSSPP